MEIHKGADGAIVTYVFLILGCPLMRPEPGFVEFVILPSSTLCSLFFLISFTPYNSLLPCSSPLL